MEQARSDLLGKYDVKKSLDTIIYSSNICYDSNGSI